ncbi:hypothetical protein PPTG_23840 [Phytophthora nicotianae INRA-310]|uniref:Uncharacterized protein n=1 Tax=Phytophthora nicotianae (strain INRA-310) TaxID=761204 RepID=W2PQL7_PHYN3|nr:hypothetical protein PPTG_23840 [Phytophthora nicotianae INRA-310]ETN03197.1 hypothetical protein PPTG_23840 [Phytophthora nicotianae INRA-310]
MRSTPKRVVEHVVKDRKQLVNAVGCNRVGHWVQSRERAGVSKDSQRLGNNLAVHFQHWQLVERQRRLEVRQFFDSDAFVLELDASDVEGKTDRFCTARFGHVDQLKLGCVVLQRVPFLDLGVIGDLFMRLIDQLVAIQYCSGDVVDVAGTQRLDPGVDGHFMDEHILGLEDRDLLHLLEASLK